MTSLTLAYPLKLPQDTSLRCQLDMLHDHVTQASQQLLVELWSDHWIDTLASIRKQQKKNNKKAYKVINEQLVSLTTPNGRVVYLPS
jgi:predicted ATPase